MSSDALVPVLNPTTGKVHLIPTNQVGQARAAGGKPVAQMKDPTGTTRYVPVDQVQEAQKHGGTLIPYGANDPSTEKIVQAQTGIRPYDNPAAQGLAGVGRAVASPVTGLTQAVRAAFTTPQLKTPDEDAAYQQWGPLGLGFQRSVVQPAKSAYQTATRFAKDGHPILAAGAALGALPIIGPMGQALGQRAAAGDIPGAITEGATQALMPTAVKEGTRLLQPAMSSTASGIINKGVVGARDADFARDANLGRGYLKNNLGVSSSMQSIADKSGEALDVVGQQIGDSLDQQTGKLIPADTIRKAIHPIIDKAMSDTTAPGVVADPSMYQQLRDSFEPMLQKADAQGGISPRELWDVRHTMNKSLNWGDQTRANLTKTQQRVSGALGGAIEDAVPGMDELNENYKDLVKLHGRAAKRAATGQGTLSGLAGKLGSTAMGGIAGGAAHSPLGAAGGALAGAALDSIPVKTGVATALQSASGINPAASYLTTVPAALAGVPRDAQPQNVGDPKKDQSAKSANDNVTQSAPAAQSVTPGYHPDTHVFSLSDWRTGNPDGDPDEAKAHATSLGFTVTV